MNISKYSTIEIRSKACSAFESGSTQSQIAKMFGVNRTTVFRWVKRYDKKKANSGLVRKPGSGRPLEIPSDSNKIIAKTLTKPASKFGFETDFWTCRRVNQVLKRDLKIKTSKTTVWRFLKRINLSYQKPERVYLQASKKARTDWIKYTIPEIIKVARKHKAIIYFQDESNISLTPVLAKTWLPVGVTPKTTVTGSRGGVAAMSAISGSGQLIFNLFEKRISSPEIIAFLAQMLAHHKNRHLVVIMDNAPCHKSKMTQDFIASQKRLRVFNTPTYSPDLNADEKVWQYLKNEALKDHQATTKLELKKLAAKKLKEISKNKSLVKGIFFRCCVADFFEMIYISCLKPKTLPSRVISTKKKA